MMSTKQKIICIVCLIISIVSAFLFGIRWARYNAQLIDLGSKDYYCIQYGNRYKDLYSFEENSN